MINLSICVPVSLAPWGLSTAPVSSSRLLLVRFKRRDGQSIMAPAVSAADEGPIFEYVHLAERERRRMRLETPGELSQSLFFTHRISRQAVRLAERHRGFRHDGGQGKMMDEPAGAATEYQCAMFGHPFHRHTQRVDRPTLLQEGSAANDLRHGCSQLPDSTIHSKLQNQAGCPQRPFSEAAAS
jgi:hypothetical protein